MRTPLQLQHKRVHEPVAGTEHVIASARREQLRLRAIELAAVAGDAGGQERLRAGAVGVLPEDERGEDRRQGRRGLGVVLRDPEAALAKDRRGVGLGRLSEQRAAVNQREGSILLLPRADPLLCLRERHLIRRIAAVGLVVERDEIARAGRRGLQEVRELLIDVRGRTEVIRAPQQSQLLRLRAPRRV